MPSGFFSALSVLICFTSRREIFSAKKLPCSGGGLINHSLSEQPVQCASRGESYGGSAPWVLPHSLHHWGFSLLQSYTSSYRAGLTIELTHFNTFSQLCNEFHTRVLQSEGALLRELAGVRAGGMAPAVRCAVLTLITKLLMLQCNYHDLKFQWCFEGVHAGGLHLQRCFCYCTSLPNNFSV